MNKFIKREIKDRVAIGDDLFKIETLLDGRVRLVPSPSTVNEVGTDINKAYLQPIENILEELTNITIINCGEIE